MGLDRFPSAELLEIRTNACRTCSVIPAEELLYNVTLKFSLFFGVRALFFSFPALFDARIDALPIYYVSAWDYPKTTLEKSWPLLWRRTWPTGLWRRPKVQQEIDLEISIWNELCALSFDSRRLAVSLHQLIGQGLQHGMHIMRL